MRTVGIVRKCECAVFVIAAVIFVSGCSKPKQQFPQTERRPVTDEYFGVKVEDDYRWLDNFNDPAVRKWIESENAFSRSYFDKTPSPEQIRERLKQLYNEQLVNYSSLVLSGKLFALKSQPPKNQPFIVVLDSPTDLQSERVVVDPNVIDPKGTTAIDWFVPSRNGRLVAVSLSENGSENGSVHVFNVATGKEVGEVVPHAQFPTAGGSLDWNKEGTGFYYTRYPQGDERPPEDRDFFQEVYYHRLGTPSSKDSYVIGKDFPRIAEIQLSSSEDGNYLLAQVADGDGGEFAHFLRTPGGKWIQLTQFSDEISTAVFGKGTLYLLSHQNAPKGKVLAMPLAKPSLSAATVVVPESDVSIADVLPGKQHLYVVGVDGGPSQVKMFGLGDKSVNTIAIEPLSSVHGLLVLDNDDLIYSYETYLSPPLWYRYSAAGRSVAKISLGTTSSVDFSGMEVVREFATSKDGTKIPLNILRRKGTELNGKNPTILYGYGGFDISESPNFQISRLLWLEQGGVYVIANLRGGGEFGEEWHDEGKLTNKQNVFDDFLASAEYLIKSNYTTPSKLAIEGGSNGGLLMGAALTQGPNLFRAVVSYVGIYDMLRVERFPNGAFNVTEYGTVKNPEQFKALYAYSPYQHVVDGTKYPAVLFLTGDNDGRVDPANSRKMTARLQAATSSDLPILLRTDSNTGHGIGTGLSTRAAQDADVYAFLFDQLGVHYKAIATK